MRSNLLSLQGTQNQIDITQNRLSTGKKVNSALDGPQAFFASQALTNRASDLNRLLDSIGQSIQVIKAADNGVTALSKLVEQADSIASQARDALAQGTAEAKATGNKDLRNIADLTDLNGVTAGDQLVFRLTTEEGNGYDLDGNGTVNAADDITITITAGMSINELVTQINDVLDADNNQVLEAKLDDKGGLEIRTLRGGNFSMNFAADAPSGTSDPVNLAFAQALGFGDMANLVANGAGNNTVAFTATSDVALTSSSMVRNATGDIAQRSTLLSDLRSKDAPTTNLFAGLDNVADDYTISVNGGAIQSINLTSAAGASLTVQDFIDQINNNTTLNTKIEASFDEKTGQVSIAAIDPTVTNIEIGVVGDAATTANFGFGTTSLVSTGTDPIRENLLVGKAAAQLANFEKEFNNIREQITQLVSNGDTGYRGTNLLNGNDLLTVFNENRTSNLTTEGVNFTAEGLGLSEANFARADTVDAALAEAREALNTIRDFGSTLANDLSVIQTRQTFTTELINTLKEGSAKLVDADQNEEGAKLLALQTRQSLGVTALSLASQSQQSILRLF
jgi:flagellin-like hook-associated protein FlgL